MTAPASPRVIVRMTRNLRPWNAGEVVTFLPAQAERLIRQRYAVEAYRDGVARRSIRGAWRALTTRISKMRRRS